MSVQNLLKGPVVHASNICWEGVYASEPIYFQEDAPFFLDQLRVKIADFGKGLVRYLSAKNKSGFWKTMPPLVEKMAMAVRQLQHQKLSLALSGIARLMCGARGRRLEPRLVALMKQIFELVTGTSFCETFFVRGDWILKDIIETCGPLPTALEACEKVKESMQHLALGWSPRYSLLI
jgi:hypothetical protein